CRPENLQALRREPRRQEHGHDLAARPCEDLRIARTAGAGLRRRRGLRIHLRFRRAGLGTSQRSGVRAAARGCRVSGFSGRAAGWMSYPFVSHWRAVADTAISQQNYPSATFVDTTLARLGGGFEWGGAGPFSFASGVSGTFVALDGKRNNTDIALDVSGVYGF